MEKDARAAVPPPLIFLGTIIVGVVLNIIWPSSVLSEARIGDALGLAAILGSLGLAVWAIRTMRGAGEHPDPDVPTKTIVANGPFAYSRNPIYLSFALFSLGLGLVLNNLWLFVAVVMVMVYVDRAIIRREEAYLEARFGQEYLNYKKDVRRWL